MCQKASVTESRVEKGEEWPWRDTQKTHSTILSQCLGLLGDESMILYLLFFLYGRSSGTLRKIKFNSNTNQLSG